MSYQAPIAPWVGGSRRAAETFVKGILDSSRFGLPQYSRIAENEDRKNNSETGYWPVGRCNTCGKEKEIHYLGDCEECLKKEKKREAHKDSCCYITSACLDDLGIPRTALEMTSMKTLTKEHILKSFGGIKDYIRYGRRAPRIVEAIRAREDSRKIWGEVYSGLRDVASAVASREYERGYQKYKNLVLELENRFVLKGCFINR